MSARSLQMETPMSFKHSLTALILCADVAGCAANPNPEITFFVPGTDTPIAVNGPTWDMAAVPSSSITWWDESIGDVVAIVAISQ
jgi:hypothetical protein